MKFVLSIIIRGFIAVFALQHTAIAAVSGSCSTCHTMHNSQDGSRMTTGYDDTGGPYTNLLRYNGCLGCHTSTDNRLFDTVTNAPIVYNTIGPYNNQGLAGGNFYWVAQGENSKGHNVFLGQPDPDLDFAPGDIWKDTSSCDSATTCHRDLSNIYAGDDPGLQGRYGCTGCHMVNDSTGPTGYHHANDDDDGTPSTPYVIDDFPWYRFLRGHRALSPNTKGVSGIEDADYEDTSSETDHNEYLGEPDIQRPYLYLAHTMTAYCGGCHRTIQNQHGNNGVWIRHPSDAVLPTTGEYTQYTTYDPLVPMARPSLPPPNPGKVRPGIDMVMCLSCHRPHGSPYPDMLRWDYNEMIAGGGPNDEGCFKCHSQKDEQP